MPTPRCCSNRSTPVQRHSVVRRTIVAALVIGIVVAIAGCGNDSSESSNAARSDSTAPMQVSDEELITKFFELVQAKDIDGLDDYLSPAFQLQRSDGSHATKQEYLANLSDLESFEVLDVAGTGVGDVRVIRSTFIARATIDGRMLSTDPAPRLSTFVWNGERWQIVSHANFAEIESEPDPATSED